MMRVIDADTKEVQLGQLEVADSFWKRFRGLQFRRSLPFRTGILITPCSSLHTCFMRFPIDVVMLDINGVVIGTRSRIQPWRVVLCEPGTKQVIEINPGALIVRVGTRLRWSDESSIQRDKPDSPKFARHETIPTE